MKPGPDGVNRRGRGFVESTGLWQNPWSPEEPLLMCDTLAIVEPGRVLFAKNSDRDPNEAQYLDWHPRETHPAGASVQCTWIAIPQVRETHAILLSRPFWMWGGEMGANEHGVVIGNEAVFTKQPYAKSGLLGMDMIRLALERAETAEGAVEVITQLLVTHGQGGGCSHENRSFLYHNSFIVADRTTAFVLETAGGLWATERISGARSISNGLTIPGFAEKHSDFIKTRVSGCRARQSRTSALSRTGQTPADLMATLRDHGPDAEAPHYSWVNGGMSYPCMHGGGVIASSQTTASWVAELTPTGVKHWVTATAAPCTSLFKPVRVTERLELGPPPTDKADGSIWWEHERFHRLVVRNPEAAARVFAKERDEIERAWLAAPPEPAAAFAKHRELLKKWTPAVAKAVGGDSRPGYVQRYWAKRDRRAGLAA